MTFLEKIVFLVFVLVSFFQRGFSIYARSILVDYPGLISMTLRIPSKNVPVKK